MLTNIIIIITITAKFQQHPRGWVEWVEIKVSALGDFSHRVRDAEINLVSRKPTWVCCQQEIGYTMLPAS
jgi:hypothetical protein